MSSIIRIVNDKIADLSLGVDRTVDEWFLMRSPVPLLAILGVYLVFVLKIGPALMANRKPFDLKSLMVFYNAFQVIFSTWLCYTSFQESSILTHLSSKKCEVVRNREQTLMLYSGAWFYFFSKIVDLLDTLFFVLRKKQSQVTFLHVYHHTVTALFSWGYLKYAPGEQGVIVGILNSGVHITMYFYYMVSAMGPKYQKFLWWKKYLTSLQLIQFILILSYLVVIAIKDCTMPKSLTIFFMANTTIFLYLFGQFYMKTYKAKKLKNLSNGHSVTGAGAGASGAAAAVAAAVGNGVTSKQPKNNLLAQGDEIKRLIKEIDVNNNTNNNNNHQNNTKSIKRE